MGLLLFGLFVIGGMFYSLKRDGGLEDVPIFWKLFLGFTFVLCLIPVLMWLTGDSGSYSKRSYRSNTTEYCNSGSYLDKFDNGGSQWRNPNGRFCEK